MQTNEELAAAVQAGNRDAINQLWVQCYGFIRHHALRWARAWIQRPDFDDEDLTQCGYIALCEAVRGYQAEKGNFLGYLLFYLKTEFAKCAGCRTKAQAAAPLNHAISLDAPAYKDSEGETTIGDTIPADDPGFEAVEDAIYREQVAGIMREALDSLPERQRKAIEAYYLDGKTYCDIGEAFEVSATSAEWITKDGLKRIRTGKHAPALSELLYGQRNLYRHTGMTAYRDSGCSSPEWELIWKEREIRRHKLKDTRAAKIRYCVEVLGMDHGRAESMFPA